MKRLISGAGDNSPETYASILIDRSHNDPNWADMRRWKELIRYYKGGAILDVGCLDSQIPGLIEKKDDYYGIDLAIDPKKMADKFPGANYAKYDLYRLKNWKGTKRAYDYAVLGEVLEHLERPYTAVREVFSVLKPGGTLAISVPLEEENEPGAVDGDRHLWSFREEDIRDMVKELSSSVKTKVLGSKWFPYRYCWPQLILWAVKK